MTFNCTSKYEKKEQKTMSHFALFRTQKNPKPILGIPLMTLFYQ